TNTNTTPNPNLGSDTGTGSTGNAIPNTGNGAQTTTPPVEPSAGTSTPATTPSLQSPPASESTFTPTPVLPSAETAGSISGQEEELIGALVNAAQSEDQKESEQEEGDKKAVHLELNKNTIISESVVRLVQKSEADLVVTLSDGSFWTIHTATVDNMPKEVDMQVAFASGMIPEKLLGQFAQGKQFLEFQLAHEGDFGFQALLTLSAGEALSGMIANLFYYNPGTESLEYQTETTVTQEGYVTLPFTHASEYVLIFAKTSMSDRNAEAENVAESGGVTEEETETASEKEEERTFLLPVLMVAAAAGILLVVGVFVYRRWKENRYFDEDIDDYKEKSDV
ncbi:MAG: hypothetical protein IJC59_07140, partial [Lachnospiraceae bacterium]|nr:hypothetical protein [Lachnospiraceae bacterium]